MKVKFALLTFFWVLNFGAMSQATEVQVGAVEQVESRGVLVPIYAVWKKNAVANLVLYSGGGGGYGVIEANGWPDSKNFLIRSA
jgi:hypothetical protein